MNHPHPSRWTRTFRNRSGKRHQLRLRLEQLESRYLLAGDLGGIESESSAPPPITWFESFAEVPRIAFESLSSVDRVYPGDFQGPRELAAGEWIIQLSDSAARRTSVLQTADRHLNDAANHFTIIAGLGAEGLILVRGEGVTAADIRASLEQNDSVESYSLNSVITGQATTPNDFSPSVLEGLDKIDVQSAWDQTTGSMQTVVGVVDSGIDLDHPDLYLNIWINQGEIPADLEAALEDIDNDGLITFYDLNNLHIIDGDIYVHSSIVWDTEGNFVSGDLASEDEMTRETPWSAGPNGVHVKDLPGEGGRINGRIDAFDLLQLKNPLWADGRDTDQNGFFDDLFGVNFRSGSDDPLPSNDPDDVLGHGTHVAGTIGAIGNNFTGVVGINWQTSLMSLRILDNNNRSDAGAGLRAVNYAKMMRERHEVASNGRTTQGANVRVLNNSWGQPGGYEPVFESSIGELGEAGVLFVAAAGNGDLFGNGVNNDVTPFYPASYKADNIISVAASTFDDRLATFSNYGATSVDIAAPGAGILSTIKGGGTGTANGTSMAAPHVAGTAALIWSELPQSTVAEIKSAILSESSVHAIAGGQAQLATGGRLDASAAINADVFAPTAKLKEWNDIESGGTFTEFTVEYWHRDGIDPSSLGSDDLLVNRTWGPRESIPVDYVEGSRAPTSDGLGYTARYRMKAPGGGSFENAVEIPITDGSAEAISSQLLVKDVSQLRGEFTVAIDLVHANASDLTVTLVGPDGNRAILLNNADGSFDGSTDAVFDDEAQRSFADEIAPYESPVRPLESVLGLGASGPNGLWTLEIEDPVVGDVGVLEGWRLDFHGSWDPMDYGEYQINTVEGAVRGTTSNARLADATLEKSFRVQIEDDTYPDVVYVDSYSDGAPNSLRNAINSANASGASTTIILAAGIHSVTSQPVGDPESPFPGVTYGFCGAAAFPSPWSGPETGDLDVSGTVTIIGGDPTQTVIDGGSVNRLFKVHPGGKLNLSGVTLANGLAPIGQDGGAILSAGELHVSSSIVRDSDASRRMRQTVRGGAIAVWDGVATIEDSWITGNSATFGGGLFACGDAEFRVDRSTFSGNEGGAIHSHSVNDSSVINSTFSDNSGGRATVFNGRSDGLSVLDSRFPASVITNPLANSDNRRFFVFSSSADSLFPGDTNLRQDLFVYDRQTDSINRINVTNEGTRLPFNGPVVISPDGRLIVFSSSGQLVVYDQTLGEMHALQAGDTNLSGRPSASESGRFVAIVTEIDSVASLYVLDLESQSIVHVADGVGPDPTVSANGQFVVFSSTDSTLTPLDTNGTEDVFVYSVVDGELDNITSSVGGVSSNGRSYLPAITPDGQEVYFYSTASNLSGDDSDDLEDLFSYNFATGGFELVTRTYDGLAKAISGPAATFSAIADHDDELLIFTSNIENLVENYSGRGFVYNSVTKSVEGISAELANEISRISGILNDGSILVRTTSVFDTATRQYLEILGLEPTPIEIGNYQPESTLNLVLSTVASSVNVDDAVAGGVDVSDSFVQETSVNRIDPRFTTLSGSIETELATEFPLNPLEIQQGFVPTRGLRFGNQAIGAASSSYVGAVDQNGTPREVPDLGASQTAKGLVSGTLFADLNGNQIRDPNEPGIPDGSLSIRLMNELGGEDTGGEYDQGVTLQVGDGGEFRLEGLDSGHYDFLPAIPDGWSFSRPGIRRVDWDGVNPDGPSSSPSISGDGRFVAFESSATNLTTTVDTNEATDIFVFDADERSVRAVSVTDSGVFGTVRSFLPTISDDGSVIAFRSYAQNLNSGIDGNEPSVVLSDHHAIRTSRAKVPEVPEVLERISLLTTEAETPISMSRNGRFVAFIGEDPDFTEGLPGYTEIIILDRQTGGYNVTAHNTLGLQFSSEALSGDGELVIFETRSDRLSLSETATGDTIESPFLPSPFGTSGTKNALSANGEFAVYSGFGGGVFPVPLWDISENSVTNLLANIDTLGLAAGAEVSISGDGRFIAIAATLESDRVPRIYLFDQTNETSTTIDYTLGFSLAFEPQVYPTISADGRTIAFVSESPFLVEGDLNDVADIFLASNPLADPGVSRIVSRGEQIPNLDLGLIPDPGSISGVVFHDNLIPNQVQDRGESGLDQWLVYIDENENGLLDVNEHSTLSDQDGNYSFIDLPSYRDYRVVLENRIGWQTFGTDSSGRIELFLPAGAASERANFAVRQILGTGQSSDSSVSGRVFEDKNGNGVFDPVVDNPLTGTKVFFDSNRDGEHTLGANEPIEVTTDTGEFQFSGEPSRVVTVRAELDESWTLKELVGNNFDSSSTKLYPGITAFKSASDVIHADFDGDGDDDIAVLIVDGNSLAIRRNDGSGRFEVGGVDVSLDSSASTPGTSLPLSMAVGQFNADPRIDVAIVGQSTDNVLVLLDYDHQAGQFLARQSFDAGINPTDIDVGDFDDDGALDLAVLNLGSSELIQVSPPEFRKIDESETFQVLFGDGQGGFPEVSQISVQVPGDEPVSIAVDDFSDDGNLDIAVLHKLPTLTDIPFGDVSLFTGNGQRGFTLSHREPVGDGPLKMTSGDFNSDGIADLAVANVSQNTISILVGRSDGAVIRERAFPIGTGRYGVDDMDVADIDNDGDLDIVATRLEDGGIVIFRNITETTAETVHTRFEPLESFGLAQGSVFERAPLMVANFDGDTSGPNGEGTLDVVAIPKSTATINVLLNRLVDGGHRIALDGLNQLSGLDFIITPTGDVLAPLVTDVRVAASGWATSFKSAVDPQNLRGVEVPGPTPLRPLSWNGLDTLLVEFSEDIQKATGGIIDAADLTLVGINVPDYQTAAEFGITTSYSDGGGDGPFLLTIQLAGSNNFGADRVVLGLSDSIVDLAGNPLGGNSVFAFNVLPGDVDGSGGVLATDVLTVNASQFTFAGTVGYDAFRDIDGSGAVFANDVLLANGRQFTFLPPESPAAPPTLDPGSVDEFFESITSDGEGELAAVPGIKLFCNSEPNA